MPRILRCSLLTLVLLLVPPLGQAATAVSDQPTTEQQVLQLLNQIRRQNGLATLVASPRGRGCCGPGLSGITAMADLSGPR